MGNAPSKGFVHSNNDYQLAIEASKELEYLLEKEFNAHGQGLHEKVSSVESAIPIPTVRSIRFVATLRNRLIHDREMRALPDRQKFISRFNDAMVELNILIDKKRLDAHGTQTSDPGCVIS
ncbi:uncharacterized protein PITG_06453 [Phytophthora infestans T30-4]|uniref:DUF4145 domain-containing protein n=1 Tax=Phytophthora infestans (strain T30-4) TaxID=403677 RepID=D0N4W5_PHYIT|nr:uncharacterized protein PITG_06453 [Phytophthora infestans T30-4]EEY69923.1 conserved hypothetical protein [Phytophthora infestans T30-4]|eukprot:XP_002998570.1 conserved hypothetical protein [Phytophthora infestans T30-4]